MSFFFPDSMVRVHTVFTLINFTLHCWQGIMFPWRRKEKRTCGIAFSVDREIKVNSGDTLRCMCYLPRWSLRIFRCVVRKKKSFTLLFFQHYYPTFILTGLSEKNDKSIILLDHICNPSPTENDRRSRCRAWQPSLYNEHSSWTTAKTWQRPQSNEHVSMNSHWMSSCEL